MAGEGIGVSERVAATTIANWTKKIDDTLKRNYAFFAALDAKKRVKFKQSGGELRWPFQYKDHAISGYVDMGQKTYQRVERVKNANLPWRGYDSTEAISLQEKLENRGKAAIVEIFKDRAASIRKSLMRQIGANIHKSGASTNGVALNRWHGIESFGNVTGQTATDDLATTPNSTYAGQGCGYTAQNPNAVAGDADYGVWSPVIVNCNQTVSGSTAAWSDYADQYIRRMILEAQYGPSADEGLDMVFLRKSSYEDLLNILDDKERIQVQRGQGLNLVEFGFRHMVMIDGVVVCWDRGVPSTDEQSTPDTVHGYGYNFDEIELCMLNDSSIWEHEKDWTMAQGAWVLYFYSLGNLKFTSPRYHGLLKEIS